VSPVEAQTTALMGAPFGNHLLHLRHEHGHAKVLKRAAVGVAAKFDPKFVHPDDLSEAFGPEQIGAALVK